MLEARFDGQKYLSLGTADQPPASRKDALCCVTPYNPSCNRRPGVNQRESFRSQPSLGIPPGASVRESHVPPLRARVLNFIPVKLAGIKRKLRVLFTSIYLPSRGLTQQRFTSTWLPWLSGPGIRFKVGHPSSPEGASCLCWVHDGMLPLALLLRAPINRLGQFVRGGGSFITSIFRSEVVAHPQHFWSAARTMSPRVSTSPHSSPLNWAECLFASMARLARHRAVPL